MAFESASPGGEHPLKHAGARHRSGAHDKLPARRPTISAAVLALLVLGGLTACQKSIDPATGQAQTRWSLPLTAGNAEAAESQWQRCIQFRSESYCARNLPGGRPPGASLQQPPSTAPYPVRVNDP